MTRLKAAAFFCSASFACGAMPALADGHMDGKMTVNANFQAADVDADGRVTREEFVSYAARSGLDAGMAEAEYQRRVGSNAFLSSDAFGDFDPVRIARGPEPLRTRMGGDFARYDADGDGRVSFREFNTVARTQGMTSTQAAQRFVKMAGGRSYLDRESFGAGSFGARMSADPSVYDGAGIRSRIDSARLDPNGRTVTRGGVSVNVPDMDDPTIAGRTSTERGFVFERDYTSTGEPKATVDRQFQPERQRLGDLDSTPSPRMQVWGEDEPQGSLFGISD